VNESGLCVEFAGEGGFYSRRRFYKAPPRYENVWMAPHMTGPFLGSQSNPHSWQGTE
jgi:hypothetical protein